MVTGYRPWRRSAGCLLLALLALVACGGSAGAAIKIEGAWARPAVLSGQPTAVADQGMAKPTAAGAATTAMATPMAGMTGPTSAVYLVIRNSGREADRLLAARTDAARAVEMHETKLDGGVMRMSPVPAIEVPAGGQAELKPGGLHIMLIGLTRELSAGQKVPLTLRFEKSGELTVEAEIRQP